ncbi:MAG TPA: hypothetical protein VEA19_04670, partial [Actinomycetota bacterium]|nr:hypothetical protein [Actinomycetota bacterium]
SSEDGGRIATGGSDGTARVWEAESGKLLMTLAGHSNSVTGVEFLLADRLVTTSTDGTTRIWNVGPSGGRDWLSVPGPYLRLGGVAFSPDGETFAVPQQDTGVAIRDVESGRITRRLSGHGGMLTGLRFSPDGTKLIAASASGASQYPDSRTVPIWDPRSGDLVGTLVGHTDEISGVAFSPDGRRIATGSYDGTLRVWDASTGRQEHSLKVEADAFGIAFSPDRRFLLAGIGCEGPITVWDARTLRQRTVLEGHDECIQALTFHPDGRLLSASWDGTAKLWDLRTNRAVATLSGHTGPVVGVAVSPDGARIATSSIDGTAKLWDAETGTEILTLFGHDRIVHTVAFSPDGRFLATAGGDGKVSLHLMRIEELRNVARQRVTRSLTDEECRRYLHRPCPSGR